MIDQLAEEISKRKSKKKQKKIMIDGKEYNLSDFDDTHSWSKVKK